MSTVTSVCVGAGTCCKRVSEIMRFIGFAPLIRPHDRNYWVASAPELRCLLSNRKFFRGRGRRHESAERAEARRKHRCLEPTRRHVRTGWKKTCEHWRRGQVLTHSAPGRRAIRRQIARPGRFQVATSPQRTTFGTLSATSASGSPARSTFPHRQAPAPRSYRWRLKAEVLLQGRH